MTAVAKRRKIGLVLILVGVADLSLMFIAVRSGQTYPSSLTLFALVAGIFIFAGSHFAIRIASKYFVVLTGVTAALPLAAFGLRKALILQLRGDGLDFAMGGATFLVVTLGLWWMYFLFRDPETYTAAWESDRTPGFKSPLQYLILGGCIGIVLGVVAIWFPTSESAKVAEAAALSAHAKEAQAAIIRYGRNKEFVNTLVYVLDDTGGTSYLVRWDADDPGTAEATKLIDN